MLLKVNAEGAGLGNAACGPGMAEDFEVKVARERSVSH
jgi:hypothetical protein